MGLLGVVIINVPSEFRTRRISLRVASCPSSCRCSITSMRRTESKQFDLNGKCVQEHR
jgi:hypothetical protein